MKELGPKEIFEDIYEQLTEFIEHSENNGEICWQVVEGSLLEFVSDSVLLDWNGERYVENKTVFYKVVK